MALKTLSDLQGVFDNVSAKLVGVCPAGTNDVSFVQTTATIGASALAVSRLALASDSGETLELASGVTYTLTDAVALPVGVILMGPASGTATIACTGTATINGATSSITINAGQVYSAIPRATNAAAFVVKGS